MKNQTENLPAFELAKKIASVAGSKAITPRGIIRAALISRRANRRTTARAGLLRLGTGQKHTQTYSSVAQAWRERKNMSQAVRDARREKNDAKFRRLQKQRHAREERIRAIALHVGRVVGGITHYGYNIAHETYWKDSHRPRTLTYAQPGIRWEESGLWIYPIGNGKPRRIAPPLPAKLRDAVALNEPHPRGFIAAPVDGSDCFACMGPDRALAKWVIVAFCFRGHLVPESFVRRAITLEEIAAEANDEIKRLLIERYGVERYLHDSGMTPIQTDDWGTLYDLGTHKVVRLVNTTPDEDGSFREYFRTVPSSCVSAHDAVSWSFGLTKEEYQPALQS